MERLDRFTDLSDGLFGDENIFINKLANKLSSDFAARQQLGKLTVKTIPSMRSTKPYPDTDPMSVDDIDWNSLVDVLDEAAFQSSKCQACMLPALKENEQTFSAPLARPNGKLSVTVVPSHNLRPKTANIRIRPASREDPYEKFIKGVFEDADPGEYEESEDDEDFTVASSTSKTVEEEDEYLDDLSVQISMKELLDLFEDEYFVRGRQISVDRLRKRLEHLDQENCALTGFSTDQLRKLDELICRHIQLVVQTLAYCGEIAGVDSVIPELLQGLVLLCHFLF
jgi:hypothetical protein